MRLLAAKPLYWEDRLQLAGVPSWVWQALIAAGLGLGLGVLLGAWNLRQARARRRRQGRPSRPPSELAVASDSQMASGLGASRFPGSTPTSRLPGTPSSRFPEAATSRFPAGETPQGRLLEHLRQSNLDLSAQLRASAAQHARLRQEKDEEVEALREEYDQRVEELRQTHSNELKHLMTLLVEQVDGIHKAHANHVRALESEIDRWRTFKPQEAADATPTTTFASTELLPGAQRPH